MKTQTTAKVAGVILLVILGAYLMNYWGVFQKIGSSLTTVSLNGCPKDVLCKEQGIINDYECPAYVGSHCLAQCVLNCSYATRQNTISFRTNALSSVSYDNTGTWVAVNQIFTDRTTRRTDNLNVYCRTGNHLNTGDFPGVLLTFPKCFDNLMYVFNSKLYVLKWGSSSSYIEYTTDCSGVTIPSDATSITSVQSYSERGQENTEQGTTQDTYICTSSDSYSYNALGQRTETQDKITDSQSAPWIKNSVLFELQPTDKIHCSQPDFGNVRLIYDEFREDIACPTSATSVCISNNAYQRCAGGIRVTNQTFYCDTDNGFFCDDIIGNCTIPFTDKEIKIVDQYGTEKLGFIPGEKIIVKTKLSSQSTSSGDVQILVYKFQGQRPEETKTILGYNFLQKTFIPTEITNPGYGKYYIKVLVTVNGKTFQVGSTKDFSVSVPVECSLYLKTKVGGFSKVEVNDEAYLELNAWAIGAKAEIDNRAFTSTFKNVNFYINPNGYEGNPIEYTKDGNIAITYRYPIKFTEAGQFVSSATVEMDGVISEPCDLSSKIETVTLTASFTNLGSCVPYGETKEIYFEIKKNGNEYIPINKNNIQLNVVEGGSGANQDISSSIEDVATGQFKFSYTFAKKGGYTFSIEATSPDYPNSPGTKSGTSESKDGCQQNECVSNQFCIDKYGSDYVCSGGKCVAGNSPNWLIYIVVGFSVLIILIIIIVIVIYSRRKASPEISIGGL